MTPILDIRKLDLEIGVERGSVPILRGVDLSVLPGQVHGLVGESGAGKSMVGRMVLGIGPARAKITGGHILFDDTDITHILESARRNLLGEGMAMIPQDPMTSLNPSRRIGAQVDDVLRMHLGLSAREARSRTIELLDRVHVRKPARVAKQYPHELSGGMRQRVLIAIAFACRPRLIIADEPTTALDVTVQRQILALIKELQETVGTAILFITHDLGVVAKLCDVVSVINRGRILERGATSTLFAAPSHAYTRALMAATPRYDRPADVLKPVPAKLTRSLLAEAEAVDRESKHSDA